MRSAPVIAFSPIGGRPADFVTGSFVTSSSWLAQRDATNQDQPRAGSIFSPFDQFFAGWE
jgi:hypothetical protein